MFGLLSQSSKYHLNDIEQFQELGFDSGRLSFGGGGSGISQAGVSSIPASVGSNAPTQQFDISVLSGLKNSDKYLGKNRVSDIKEAYDTYLTGNPVGRGGQYAVDAAKKYGTSIIDAARGYLLGVGLPLLPSVTTQTQTDTQTQKETKNPFEILADIIPKLFGNAVYNPPLQSQSSGFTGVEQGTPLAESTGGNIGTYIVIGVIGVIAYFVYKRFAS